MNKKKFGRRLKISAIKIFLVCNVDSVVKDLETTIESLGHSVTMVKRLQKLELKPDIILVDSSLNKKFLEATISMINKLDLPFIYISTPEEGFNQEVVDQVNYFGTIIKPVDPELLKTSIEFALQKHLKEKELKDRINKLEKRESRYHALIESSFDSVYIMSPDWGEMKHLEGRNFLNSTLNPSKSWINTYIPPEEREKVLTTINNAIKDKTKFELEHKVIAADGTIGQTLSRAVPVLDTNGEIIEWIGTAKDITKRTNIEWELTETKNMLESVIESIPDAVFVSDDEGNFLKFNKAFATYHKFKSKKDVKKTLNEYPDFLEVYGDEKYIIIT
ncbi:PAS sensor protein [Methanobacterium lacus]|uniref:histidine kinase n=1 Tax=Methanobacterium lacus (strain AL-21) TaxID=877455 RepID=F0T626_METLA|nr:PAS domain S-box protein [Methanobacterium lacus]ADZ10533.1 PAS sensor protein [Methanobacterium lacus]